MYRSRMDPRLNINTAAGQQAHQQFLWNQAAAHAATVSPSGYHQAPDHLTDEDRAARAAAAAREHERQVAQAADTLAALTALDDPVAMLIHAATNMMVWPSWMDQPAWEPTLREMRGQWMPTLIERAGLDPSWCEEPTELVRVPHLDVYHWFARAAAAAHVPYTSTTTFFTARRGRLSAREVRKPTRRLGFWQLDVHGPRGSGSSDRCCVLVDGRAAWGQGGVCEPPSDSISVQRLAAMGRLLPRTRAATATLP